jgi:hypothetical protein
VRRLDRGRLTHERIGALGWTAASPLAADLSQPGWLAITAGDRVHPPAAPDLASTCTAG